MDELTSDESFCGTLKAVKAVSGKVGDGVVLVLTSNMQQDELRYFF